MKKMLLAFDGSDNAMKAAQKGISIAQAMKAKVFILTVIEKEGSPLYPSDKKIYRGDSPKQVSLMLDNTSSDKAAVEILEKAEKYLRIAG